MKINHAPTIYAFIDSQNLNLGIRTDIRRNGRIIYHGWKLDFQKFYIYLRHKCHVSKAFLFIGYIPHNESLYQRLRSYGFKLVFKPTVVDSQGKTKGNVDAELVLHAAAIEYPNYDQAVIVSGDGDFYCLLEYLQRLHKLEKLLVPNPKKGSSLLQKFEKFRTFLVYEKKRLERCEKQA